MGLNGITRYTEQCSGDDSSPLQPRRGAGNVANATCAGERNHPPTCHSERSRGIFPCGNFYLVVISYPTWWIPPLRLRYGRNDRRFWFGCYKCKRTTIPALRAGWRQIAAATMGGTTFRVIPFTSTGYTSNVAGGRLPPLHQNCYRYRIFNVSNAVFTL